MLASEYSWSKRDIMQDTYPEELFSLQRQIKARKVDEMLSDLAVAAHPHKNAEDSKEFVDDLLSRRRFYRGEKEAPDKLDVGAFERFRKQVGEESSFVKVK